MTNFSLYCSENWTSVYLNEAVHRMCHLSTVCFTMLVHSQMGLGREKFAAVCSAQKFCWL